MTRNWQSELRGGNLSDNEIKKYLNEILPYTFAAVREASKRTMNQRHRDVQLIAGIVLHNGNIAEQKTGEGKTLTATLPLYLNSLTGKGAHLVTPNDYLSRHGAGWYGPVYDLLGLKVGVLVDRKAYRFSKEYYDESVLDTYSRKLEPCSKLEAYQCDVTYGTNSEFGFDYLRDNMALSKDDMSQSNPLQEFNAHNFAIVDEVDNILIDVARTPLIISQQQNVESKRYHEYTALAEGLVPVTDYKIDEKDRNVNLTELGINKIERKLGVDNLYEKDFETIHHIENSLKAKELYIKDKDYIIRDGKVLIIDQNTGRILQSNRWSDGLHQAVEAKEKVAIQAESKTVATISYQNYYRLYNKLAGMTGTAETEAEEFFKIYSLDVVVIPTHKQVIRKDNSDMVYKTETAKYRAIAKDIKERNEKGQPILIGTTSVEKSQLLSKYLNRLKIKHEILNAKEHEKEAQVIAQAGQKGAVTVATNMAGRGVDIILGGDPFYQEKHEEIINLGGLYVIGTERHDSRRIDNQLRGRSGRQGEPGESRFYLSLQDDLMRLFGGERIESIMGKMGMDENMPIEAGLISKTIENAQKKVEGANFDKRRSVVEFDDVMNVQRESIYEMRRKIILADADNINEYFDWVLTKLQGYYNEEFNEIWRKKKDKYGEKVWFEVVKRVSLQVIQVLWMDHIDAMDDLRSGIGLRGYGQVDPIVEYKREGKEMFERLISEINTSIVDGLTKIEVEIMSRSSTRNADNPSAKSITDKINPEMEYESGEFEIGLSEESNDRKKINPVVNTHKVGRNDPCWCGSGKKYKKCHYPN